MGYGTVYTNGVIAVKERQLLGEKLLRLASMTAEEALRTLSESGFGAGGGDDPVLAEERALDAFIREYAPTQADRAYFLAPRDFHNLKALYKAEKLGSDPAPMLAPEGMWQMAELEAMLAQKKPPVPDIAEDATGAEIGAAFDRAMYAYLFRACARRGDLKKLLRARVDMTNILTACRVSDMGALDSFYIPGGALKKEQFEAAFSSDAEARESAFSGTPYREFYAACLGAARPPYTGAERLLESFEEKSYSERRFGLEGREPFLYYVFRRRAEIRNVRVILVSLRAGVPSSEIEKRLAGVK